ncbi:MAG: ABC transporter permease [Myxococcaceae bacterium]|nr:ABC transporter permease [Myxococcaceae bacterium]
MTALLRIFGAPAVLFARTVSALRRNGLDGRATMVQLVEIGSKSTLLIVAGLSFFGAVMVTIAWAQARKYTGNITVVGPAYFELMLREFAPLLVAVLAASRVGAATSAELAAMSVNEQLEALELSAADPVSELVSPRLVASLIALPALMAVGTAASAISANLVVTFAFGADGGSFTDARFVDPPDLVCALVKALLCGAFIPLAAAARGLKAKGGAPAVGEAVTSAVVDASMGCLLIDFVVAAAFLLIGV